MTSTAIRKLKSRQLPTALLVRVGLVLLYLLITYGAGSLLYRQIRASVASADILPEFTFRATEDESENVERVQGETLPVWKGTDRITVLILGIDQRGYEEDFWRTDTMILATLDPVTMDAGVLSIPRDLWVHIPGYTENRINTAHALGDAYGYPGGGPALAVETVRYNLGIETIDYYARFNFQAFEDIVDRIGGIEIEVPETIDDPCYPTPDYGCERLYIEAGPHHFYGDMALKYARTRYSTGGDFDRARRQQQVILAVFQRVRQRNMLPQLAIQAPELLNVLGHSVKLDPKLQLDEIIALANLALKVDQDAIRFRVIDETCTLSKTTPDEMMILVPLRDEVRRVRDEVFGLIQNGEAQQTLEEEAATISVLNGTTEGGLAYATSQYLEANGLSVALYANADRQDYDTSLVILNRDKPMTAQHILTVLDLPPSALVHGSNPTADHDIVVILGADYSP